MSTPELIKLMPEDFPLIQNIAAYYEYDMSRYCGHLPGWEFPMNGTYLSQPLIKSLKSYFTDTDRVPFLMRVDDHPAGFVMVNKVGTTPDVDWNMGEFFVLAPYQHRKIGQTIAVSVFNQFPGIWEVAVIPANAGALAFWEKVISGYSENTFSKEKKTLQHPEKHQMMVFKFESKKAKN